MSLQPFLEEPLRASLPPPPRDVSIEFKRRLHSSSSASPPQPPTMRQRSAYCCFVSISWKMGTNARGDLHEHALLGSFAFQKSKGFPLISRWFGSVPSGQPHLPPCGSSNPPRPPIHPEPCKELKRRPVGLPLFFKLLHPGLCHLLWLQ